MGVFFLLIGLGLLWLVLINLSLFHAPYSARYYTKTQSTRWKTLANSLWGLVFAVIALVTWLSPDRFSPTMNTTVFILWFAEFAVIGILSVVLELRARRNMMTALKENIQKTLQENPHVTDSDKLLSLCRIENRLNFSTKDITKVFHKVYDSKPL